MSLEIRAVETKATTEIVSVSEFIAEANTVTTLDLTLSNTPAIEEKEGKISFNPNFMKLNQLYTVSLKGKNYLLVKVSDDVVRMFEVDEE